MGTIVEQGISVAIRKAPASRDHGTQRASSLRVIGEFNRSMQRLA
jgi:hypothetical protein